MEAELYPLKFKTIFKDKIWGGNKIKTLLNKDFTPLPNCGETWEISGVKSDVSIVAAGHLQGSSLSSLIEKFKGELVGQEVFRKFGTDFPLLVKFIDANEDLSIQVHPNDKLAKERHNSFGKTEMWYVIQADPGATLISGFNQPVNEEIYLEKLNSGKLSEILNKEQVEDGDIFFLPAGRVHTIGKGLLIAEIQQTSDITYRIYDFDRVDDKGNKRELHTEEALAANDYNVYPEYKTNYFRALNQAVESVSCEYFTTKVLDFDQDIFRDYSSLDSFVIHICVYGSYTISVGSHSIPVKMGESILIPAAIPKIDIIASTRFRVLECFIPI